jgi:hypothetical protein
VPLRWVENKEAALVAALLFARGADFERGLRFNFAPVRLAAQDASIHKLMFDVNHSLKPQRALRAPEIAERVAKLMAATA